MPESWRVKRMVKFRLYLDKDKETEFLNGMSREGYAATGFCMGFYRFERCRPGEYIYQIDLTDGMFRVSDDYREFMRDMGVDIVVLWGFWAVLRKRAEEGPFELYTDAESSMGHYAKIKTMFKAVGIVETALLIPNLLGVIGGSSVSWLGCCILAAFVVGIFKEVDRINRILRELRERAGTDPGSVRPGGIREASAYLAAGLLLNGIGLLFPGRGVDGFSGFIGGLRGFVCGLGIVLVLAGVLQMMWRSKR